MSETSTLYQSFKLLKQWFIKLGVSRRFDVAVQVRSAKITFKEAE
jgi:hypothetical protein